jgi:hypothetical protein
MLSMPAPPVMVSLPAPPLIVSAPAPPVSESLPMPPLMIPPSERIFRVGVPDVDAVDALPSRSTSR